MPDASGIGAIGGIVGGFLGSMNAARENKINRDYADDVYARQKADQLDFWNLQNEYNSPEQQMQRFESAGLNKNLIYSRGDAGNASAPQLPAYDRPTYQQTGFDAGASKLSTIYDLQMKKQQLDNMQVQNGIMHEEQVLKRVLGERAWHDFGIADQMATTDMEYRREKLRKLKQDTFIGAAENTRRDSYAEMARQIAIERVLQMQAQTLHTGLDTQRISEAINLLRKEGNIKDFEIRLNKSGMTRNDELWQRLLGLGVQKVGFGQQF